MDKASPLAIDLWHKRRMHLFARVPALAILWILGSTFAADAQSAPFIYVSQFTGASIVVIDAATNAITATIPLGSYPAGIAVNRAGTLGYVANLGSNTVSLLDLTSNTVTSSVAVAPVPVDIVLNPAETRLYVASRDPSSGMGTVSVLDARTGSIIAIVPLSDAPARLVADPSRDRVYVSYAFVGTIAVVDTTTNTISANLNDRPDVLPSSLAITPTGTRLYVAHWGMRSFISPPPGSTLVTVIDTTGTAPVVTVDVGDQDDDVTIAPQGNRAFVATYSYVKVIDTSSNAVIASIPVPRGSTGIAFLPAAGRLYVTNSDANLVTVIDASKESVLTTIPVAGGPRSVAVAPAPTAVAVEYYYSAWNFYFETAFPSEIAALDGGAFGGAWRRTGENLNVWPQAVAGSSPTCRFFSGQAFVPKSSHFYTSYGVECSLLQTDPTLSSVWQLETPAAFYVAPTDAFGNCPAWLAPLYRAYNNGMGGAPNHRYTTNPAIQALMISTGWVAEGNGPSVIFACVPQ